MKRGLIFAALALALDQISKALLQRMFENGFNGLALGGCLNIVKTWNKGVSFSLFTQESFWGSFLLVLVALMVVAWLLYWLKSEKSPLAQMALGLVIGGALGNILDRLRFGAVFDFLDFYYRQWHWPAFNGADSFICLGVFLLIWQNIFFEKKNKGELK